MDTLKSLVLHALAWYKTLKWMRGFGNGHFKPPQPRCSSDLWQPWESPCLWRCSWVVFSCWGIVAGNFCSELKGRSVRAPLLCLRRGSAQPSALVGWRREHSRLLSRTSKHVESGVHVWHFCKQAELLTLVILTQKHSHYWLLNAQKPPGALN